MKPHRPLIALLAVYVGLPALGFADADAAFIRRSVIKTVPNHGIEYRDPRFYRVTAVVSGDAAASAVRAEVESDAGDETLELVESDAWLHGAASIAALPTAEADVTVTLYDAGSAALMSLSGTLATDGTVALSADTAKFDIELLAAELFPSGKGYELGLDLAGADTWDVAYASVAITQGAVCLVADEKGNCLKWDTSKQVTTRAEVGWDDLGSVWEADATLAHEGLIELKVKAYDAEGEKIESAKAKLGAPWLDDGEGVGTLATDEDPLTRLAFHRGRRAYHATRHASHRLTVVSEGWSAGDAVPAEAEVELTNGDTLTIPVNSYQRTTPPTMAEAQELFDMLDVAGLRLGVGDDVYSMGAKDEGFFFEVGEPLCTDTVCVTVIETADGYGLTATSYGADVDDLLDEVELSLTVTDSRGATLEVPATWVSFDDELTAVFATEVALTADPVGLGLSGTVKLLGEANKKGKQETLAKGKFYAELTRDGDGDLELAGADKDEVVPSGTVLEAGEPVGLVDPEGNPDAPPVVVYGVLGNGSGTKNAASQVSAKPQLL